METTENQNTLKLGVRVIQEDRSKGHKIITRFAA